jgi:hypothetical protein
MSDRDDFKRDLLRIQERARAISRGGPKSLDLQTKDPAEAIAELLVELIDILRSRA